MWRWNDGRRVGMVTRRGGGSGMLNSGGGPSGRPLPPGFPSEEESVAADDRLGTPALAGEREAGVPGSQSDIGLADGFAPSCRFRLLDGAAFRSSVSSSSANWPPGARNVGSGAFPPAIAWCHTAPIGNLGIRTQAMRPVDRTTDLHRVMPSALFHRDAQHARRAPGHRDRPEGRSVATKSALRLPIGRRLLIRNRTALPTPPPARVAGSTRSSPTTTSAAS